MTDAVDPVTRELTGSLPFILLLAAFLTWPIAIALLNMYTRAVRRSMRSSSGSATAAAPRNVETAAPAVPVEHATRADLYDLPAGSSSATATTLLADLIARPRRAAAAYAVGGVAYALVMTAAQLRSDEMEFLPIRFLVLSWIFVWPVVLTVGIIAASTRRQRVALVAAYFIVFFAIGAMELLRFSSEATWTQLIQAWALFDLPPTLVIWTYLSRRVRAVGPLVLVFMVIALAGSNVVATVAASDLRFLRLIVAATEPLGLKHTGTLVAIFAAGFLAFAVLGWIVLRWIRGQYQAKRISDESVTLDAIWILFTIGYSINLVFGHPLWGLAGVVAFAAYKVCVHIGLSRAKRGGDVERRTPVLLVLRSFSIGKDGERLFDVVDRFWRRVGSIQMIAGVDLARRTVEPHEFLDFISGKLARRFIGGSAELEQRMQERDTRPDRDLRFRVNDFFCYDDTWKMVLSRLASDSDAVLMDLRGFSKNNAGCVFELGELGRMVPLERVVFVVDRRTDEQLLAETLGGRRAGVFRLHSLNGRHIRELMRALAAAAAPTNAPNAA